MVLGFPLPWVFLTVINLAQRVTPTEVQGRVSAAATFAMFGPQAPMPHWVAGDPAWDIAQLYARGAIAALACAAYPARRRGGYRAVPDSRSRPRLALTGTDSPQQQCVSNAAVTFSASGRVRARNPMGADARDVG